MKSESETVGSVHPKAREVIVFDDELQFPSSVYNLQQNDFR